MIWQTHLMNISSFSLSLILSLLSFSLLKLSLPLFLPSPKSQCTLIPNLSFKIITALIKSLSSTFNHLLLATTRLVNYGMITKFNLLSVFINEIYQNINVLTYFLIAGWLFSYCSSWVDATDTESPTKPKISTFLPFIEIKKKKV